VATLHGSVKVFIVERLACFDTPTQVAEAVKQTFKVTVSTQQLAAYNPKTVAGARLSQTLKEHFEATRKKFLEDTADIPIAHKSYRLRTLNRLAEKMEGAGNVAMVAQLMEQAAKDQGEAYTNRQKLEHSGKDGGPLTVVVRKFGGDERTDPAQ
jgi:hypothetical protein